MQSSPLEGVFAPVLTPFTPELQPDKPRYVGFCRWVLGQGSGLAVFGTNSEANSLSVEEKLDLLAHLVAAGLPASRLVPGTGTCAIPDTVRLCAAAAKAGTAGVLMLPPFYYKDVSEDGLFAAYAEVIERVGSARLRILLYHIPQVSGVAITLPLIARLVHRYPDTVVGIKDSSGDFGHTRSLIENFPGFRVFCGSDSFLLETLKHGGHGCISATANINPGAIVTLHEKWRTDDAAARQAALVGVRTAVQAYPMIAALKACVAHFGACDSFAELRPPLTRLKPDDAAAVAASLRGRGFSMPGLAKQLEGEG
ncbi:MAG TPA: dihydrodipicolinate synthase family protein [Aestuariivirgaceae bacterium]|nr:dihydrodipicolinate synthase family protein [Aestuariivirgaceae bacterium]